MRTKKKFAFVGPFGSANLGDYAILINNIFDLCCDDFVVFSYNYIWPRVQLEHYCSNLTYEIEVVKTDESVSIINDATSLSLNQLELYVTNSKEIRNKLHHIDCLVVSGGGWINDFWARRSDKICKLLFIIKLADSIGIPIEFMSQGISPFGVFDEGLSTFLKELDVEIRVRDSKSEKVLSDRQIISKYVPDDLMIQSIKWDSFKSYLPNIEGEYIVIEPFANMEELKKNESLLKKYFQAIKTRYNVNLIFLPFDLVYFGNDQARYCHSLVDGSYVIDINQSKYPKYEDVMKLIRGAKLVVSCRYHGFVLSLTNNVPTIHVVNNISGDYGMIKAKSILTWCMGENFDSNMYTCDTLINALDTILNNYESIIRYQNKFYQSESYKNNLCLAYKEREKLICSIKL